MKQSLLLITAGLLLFSSCNQQNGDATDKQHIIDSLVKLVPAGPNKLPVRENFATPAQAPASTFSVMPVSAYTTPVNEAAPVIQNYHALFRKDKKTVDATIDKNNIGRSSFIIPVSTIQSLITEKKSSFLVFYLGYSVDKQINLFYTGVAPVGNRTDSFTEVTVTNPDIPGTPCIFNNATPCPTCVGIGVHSPVWKSQPFISIDSVQNGKITSPSGYVPGTKIFVDFGQPKTITYEPNNGYEFDKLIINNTTVKATAQEHTQYTFNKVESICTFQVFFKLTPAKSR